MGLKEKRRSMLLTVVGGGGVGGGGSIFGSGSLREICGFRRNESVLLKFGGVLSEMAPKC